MIKLEMELSDIDYEVLVKEILPKVADRLRQNGSPLAPLLSGGMAANVLLHASDSVRDRMAAEILNAAAPRLSGTLEKLAADNGVPCKVQGLRRPPCKNKGQPPKANAFGGCAILQTEQKSPETEISGEKCRIRIIVPPLLRGVRRKQG